VDTDRILEVAGVLAFLLISVSVHESAHAWTADRLGDPTARKLGRVTLNPAAHLDPFLSILLPIVTYLSLNVAFGAGKPVPVAMRNLRHPRRDFMLVALAGPLSNLCLAFATTALWWGATRVGLGLEPSLGVLLLKRGILMNVALAIFNLLPVPALDGSRVIGWLLPGRLAYRWYSMERFGGFILLGLLLLPRLDRRLDLLSWIIAIAGGSIVSFMQSFTGLPILAPY
jgi:Zn-dependent protease